VYLRPRDARQGADRSKVGAEEAGRSGEKEERDGVRKEQGRKGVARLLTDA
jgi:hypothetical protein